MYTLDENDVLMRDKLEHLERVVEKVRQDNSEMKDKVNELRETLDKILAAVKN